MNNPAIVFQSPNEPVLEQRETPRPGPKDLLVKTSASLISIGTELTMLSGDFPPGSTWAEFGRFPTTTGYCNTGYVVDAGSAESKAWIGRRVVSHSPHAAYVITDATAVREVGPADLSDEEGTFFALSEIAMNGVRRGAVTWGEPAVVFGLGLVGQLAVRFCRLAGARPVFGVDISGKRLEMLPDDSGIIRVDPSRDDPRTVIASHTRGRLARVAFEATGDPGIIPEEIQILEPEGRFVILSAPRGGGTWFNFHDLCNWPSYSIIGAHNHSHPRRESASNPWTMRRHSELFFDLVTAGELDVRTLITHRISFQDAPAMYRSLLQDRSSAMGVVINWGVQTQGESEGPARTHGAEDMNRKRPHSESRMRPQGRSGMTVNPPFGLP